MQVGVLDVKKRKVEVEKGIRRRGNNQGSPNVVRSDPGELERSVVKVEAGR